MMNSREARDHIRVVLQCRKNRRHELCVPWPKPVNPALSCPAAQGSGFGPGGGCCAVPGDLNARIERVLRGDYSETRRRGYVLIEM